MRILVAAAILAGSLHTAFAADRIANGPQGLAVRCSDFFKGPDGTWRALSQATLSYPIRLGSFSGNSIAQHGVIIKGVDIADFLNKNCAEK